MKNNQLKKLIFSITFLIFSVGSFVFLYKTINSNQQKFTELNQELKNEEAKKQSIQELNKNISEILNQITELDTHFLKTDDVAIFLDDLEKTAKDIGLKLEVVGVEPPSETQNGLVMNLKALGSFESVNDFIVILENYKYEIDILDFDTQKESFVSENNNTENWNTNIKIKIVSIL